MELYCTSQNTGPTWSGTDPIRMLYLGTDRTKAIEAVGDFVRYEKESANTRHPHSLSALPNDIDWVMVAYYAADGFWKSVVMFEIN